MTNAMLFFILMFLTASTAANAIGLLLVISLLESVLGKRRG